MVWHRQETPAHGSILPEGQRGQTFRLPEGPGLRGSPGLRGRMPRFFPNLQHDSSLPQESASTNRVQGLELLSEVSHSTLLARVCRVPGTLFLQPTLCRLLEVLALPQQGPRRAWSLTTALL